MARNYEKNFGRLNRLWLAKDQDKSECTRRPRLIELHSGTQIEKWLPHIRAEMDFCLKQIQVPCYTDNKVEEYKAKLVKLELEYRSFVRKLRKVDPTTPSDLGAPRPYQRKRPAENGPPEEEATVLTKISPPSEATSLPPIKRLHLPILEVEGNEVVQEEEYQEGDSVCHMHEDLMDKPLEFRTQELDTGAEAVHVGATKEVERTNPLGITYSSSDEDY